MSAPETSSPSTPTPAPATATAFCFCAAVALSFPTSSPGTSHITICHCLDCRKISASMFCSNFSVLDTHLVHIRGQDNLKTYSTTASIASGQMMTNYFCGACGTLMYRVGARFPGMRILRLGTLDDTDLVEGVMRPRFEQFVESRVGWLEGVKGEVEACLGGAF